MAHYERIYAPDGGDFEVPADRAAELILNEGWSRQPVVAAPAEPERAVTQSEPPSVTEAEPAPTRRPAHRRTRRTLHLPSLSDL